MDEVARSRGWMIEAVRFATRDRGGNGAKTGTRSRSSWDRGTLGVINCPLSMVGEVNPTVACYAKHRPCLPTQQAKKRTAYPDCCSIDTSRQPPRTSRYPCGAVLKDQVAEAWSGAWSMGHVAWSMEHGAWNKEQGRGHGHGRIQHPWRMEVGLRHKSRMVAVIILVWEFCAQLSDRMQGWSKEVLLALQHVSVLHPRRAVYEQWSRVAR
jgi:hypothetical protein